MEVTEEGILMDVNPEHSLNALFPIVVSEVGQTIVFRLVLWKAIVPIVTRPAGNLMVSSLLHPANTRYPKTLSCDDNGSVLYPL